MVVARNTQRAMVYASTTCTQIKAPFYFSWRPRRRPIVLALLKRDCSSRRPALPQQQQPT
jgi:hypothetical protein